MDTLIKTSRLSWYITAAYRKCCTGLTLKTGYIYPRFHIVFDNDFTTKNARITKKLPANWDDIFKNHCELPTEEFQFSIGKQWKTPTDLSEGYRKEKNNSPTDSSDGNRKVNNNSPIDQTDGDRKVKKTNLLTRQRETAR